MIRFSDIAKRITGISTPIFGISWNPPANEREIARGLLLFLEDKRALSYEQYCEYSPHVTESIINIRSELTNTLRSAAENSPMVEPLKAMRAACRKFLDESQVRHGRSYLDHQTWIALGELRGVFGLHIARLCAMYGIDASEELCQIMPAAD